jgi:hypothetical protein
MTLAGPIVVFSWELVSGCTFDGYVFRICTTDDLDDVENCLVDAVQGATERTETLESQEGGELCWGVQVANAPGGAEWTGRCFRIELAPAALAYLPLILIPERD